MTDQPTGRCGNQLTSSIIDTPPTFCALPHGHNGWHRADNGTEWNAPIPNGAPMSDFDTRPMTPQPYALFAAELTSVGVIHYGRIIGWIDTRDETSDEERTHDWLPVMAYQDEDDGGIYHTAAVSDGSDLFISDDANRALARARKRKETCPKSAPAAKRR